MGNFKYREVHRSKFHLCDDESQLIYSAQTKVTMSKLIFQLASLKTQLKNVTNASTKDSMIQCYTRCPEKKVSSYMSLICSPCLRPTLDGRLSALPPFDLRDGRRSTESRQFRSLLKNVEEVITLTSKVGIALTLNSRLSADFHQN